MGKQPVKLKAVVYALSPFQQKIMPGLWKDLPGKIHHKVSENWISATLLLSPLEGGEAFLIALSDIVAIPFILIFICRFVEWMEREIEKEVYGPKLLLSSADCVSLLHCLIIHAAQPLLPSSVGKVPNSSSTRLLSEGAESTVLPHQRSTGIFLSWFHSPSTVATTLGNEPSQQLLANLITLHLPVDFLTPEPPVSR
uniref:Uncharacterized protein n=1 Tax=Salix viminalis TaxID=40686 RepID=A0A6N2LEN4_SALVM